MKDDGQQDPSNAERVRLAQADQRLKQEELVFKARLAREQQLRRIQVALSWVIVAMLPIIAIGCIAVFFLAPSLPEPVVISASTAFFVDVVGLVVTGYRGLLPSRKAEDLLIATTADPYVGSPAPEDKNPKLIKEVKDTGVGELGDGHPAPSSTGPDSSS